MAFWPFTPRVLHSRQSFVLVQEKKATIVLEGLCLETLLVEGV